MTDDEHTSTARRSHAICRTSFPIRLIVLVVLLPACSGPVVSPSDAAAATQLTARTLDQWQRGRPVAELRNDQPPVFVADDWWHNGYRLDAYSIQGSGELIGTNVRVILILEASDPNGRKNRRTQSYLVTTTPALTLAREDR